MGCDLGVVKFCTLVSKSLSMPMAGVSFNEKIDPDLYSLSYVSVDILWDIHCSHATVWVICWGKWECYTGSAV